MLGRSKDKLLSLVEYSLDRKEQGLLTTGYSMSFFNYQQNISRREK